MSDSELDNDDCMDGALERLMTASKSGLIHQGVTTPKDTAGPSTRSGVRRPSEGAAGPTRKTRKKHGEIDTRRDIGMDVEETPTRKGVNVERPPEDILNVLLTIMTDVQKTVNEIKTTVNVMHEQQQQDKQRMTNLEMRIENIQQARMLSLTTQAAPSTSTTPASGRTPHRADTPEGPVFI